MDTIQIDGWQGRLGQGLAPRQLMATIYAAKDMTAKEIARRMDCSPSTIKKQLDTARFKLGMQRTIRGLCLEAMRRGIIAPARCSQGADRCADSAAGGSPVGGLMN